MWLAGILAKIEFAFRVANFTSKLSNLRCFEAFYTVFVFCWRGRCGSEAWLNFTKRADTAANSGVARFEQ